MTEILTNAVLSASGVSVVVLVLSRLIPNDRLLAWCRVAGRGVSGFGRRWLGRTFWEKLEDFVENSVTVAWRGFREGLNEDDTSAPGAR